MTRTERPCFISYPAIFLLGYLFAGAISMKKKKTHRRTFWWTVFIVLVAVCIMDLSMWFALDILGGVMDALITSAPGQPEVTAAINTFHSLEHYFLIIGMPASFLLFLLVVGSIRMVYKPGRPEKRKPSEKPSEPTKETEHERARKRALDQRLFLHIMSLLQREGRLIDFFAEDLEAYEDDQIGAAVREIHSTCRRVVEKSLSLKPVIDSMEGETVTVERGFDPGAIKLVGNVSGEPPFSGVLRHRGWQAGKIEMPTFPGDQNPGVIAPAEVEIQ
jgi:hypothetical protein